MRPHFVSKSFSFIAFRIIETYSTFFSEAQANGSPLIAYFDATMREANTERLTSAQSIMNEEPVAEGAESGSVPNENIADTRVRRLTENG